MAGESVVLFYWLLGIVQPSNLYEFRERSGLRNRLSWDRLRDLIGRLKK